MSVSTKIFIKSIPRDTASRIHEYKNGKMGKPMNKTKLGNFCKDGIQALYSPKIGGLKTGLYKTMTASVNGVEKEITLQEWAETKWGLEKDYLSNKRYEKNGSLRKEDVTYFQNKVWKLNDGTTILDLDNLDDFCFYHVCLESKYVANSEKEWKEHKWQRATHYISHENEPDEIKMRKNNRKALAYRAMTDSDFTLPWKRKIAVILEVATDRVMLSEEQVNNLMYEYIDKSENHDGPTNINKVLAKYAMLAKADTKEQLEAEYMLKSAVDWRIVIEKAGTYTWLSHDMQIGFNKAEALDFLTDVRKQTFIDELQEEIKLKKLS